MDYGSSHVWVYDDSDEEFMSETELQEGMWLSESEGEEDVQTIVPPVVSKPSKQASGVEINSEQENVGSTTKYLSSSDSSDEDDLPQPGKADSSKYVEVEHFTKKDVYDSDDELEQPVRHKPKSSSKSAPTENQSVEYVKVKDAATPVVSAQKPEGLPPPPLRGAIKNKLASGRVKRLKKQRVRWERSARDSSERSRGRQTRRADTNVLAVKFNTLTEPSNVHTGDAVICCNPSCTSILSHLSKLTDPSNPDKEEKVWLCEFCGTQNEVDIVAEEIPTKEDTTFITAPAPLSQKITGGATTGVEDALVVFCIDISGSMCVTTEVPGKFQLKGHDRIKKLSTLNVDNEDQYMPRQRRDVTYVSRLQSVQAAVDHQLTQLSTVLPSQKVAIVTFSDEVTIIGNGRNEQTFTIAGDKLSDSEAIVKIGDELPLPASIKDTRRVLSEKLFELEEGGQTALGPALLLSISLAGRVPGSKVVICTDGLANKGVGNLDDLKTDEAQAEAQTFYEDMGTLAVENGVTVSLVRIKGTDCKALELGQVADKTGGQVTTVDPLNITREFSTILANPVIATQVTTKIVLHRELYFRTEESKESLLTIPVGNVTATTELTYEYGVRSKKNSSKSSSEQKASASPETQPVPPLKVDGKECLPFQLQIQYTGQDGSTNIRVITQAKPITRDRNVAEKDIDMAVVGTHVAHRTAALAMQGEYTQARISALSNQRLLQRTSHTTSEKRNVYLNVMEDLIPLENELCRRQETERQQFGRNYSDDEDEERFFYERNSELMGTALAQRKTQSEGSQQTPGLALASTGRRGASVQTKTPIPKAKKKKAISRRKDIDDDLATYMYNISGTKTNDYETPSDHLDKPHQ